MEAHILSFKPYFDTTDYLNLISTNKTIRQNALRWITSIGWSEEFWKLDIPTGIFKWFKHGQIVKQVLKRQQFIQQLPNLKNSRIAGFAKLLQYVQYGHLDHLTCLYLDDIYSFKQFTDLLEQGHLHKLKKLELDELPIKDDDLEPLFNVVQKEFLSDLEFLSIMNHDLGGMRMVARIIAHLPKLKTLFLWGPMGQHGMEYISEALITGVPNLDQLSLNAIPEKLNAQTLALAFRSGKLRKLQALNLQCNQLTSDDLICLLDAMRDGGMHQIFELLLNSNNIDNRGFRYLVDFIRDNNLPFLRNFEIDDNSYTEEGSNYFIEQLPHLESLFDCIR